MNENKQQTKEALMKIRQTVSVITLFGLLLFVTGCGSDDSKIPPVAKKNNLTVGGENGKAGIGVAVADMNGDGYLDIISAGPDGIRYFESDGNGGYFERGKIADTEAWNSGAGVGIAVMDLDDNGVLDIVTASPEGIRITKNPIPQK
jgi:hypothetical protein